VKHGSGRSRGDRKENLRVLFVSSRQDVDRPTSTGIRCSLAAANKCALGRPQPKATLHTGPVPSSMRSSQHVLATSVSFAIYLSPFLRLFADLPFRDVPPLVDFLCVLVRIHGLWQAP
jgi:hypothetical protein